MLGGAVRGSTFVVLGFGAGFGGWLGVGGDFGLGASLGVWGGAGVGGGVVSGEALGIDELAQEKLKDLLKLKYHALADAIAELGRPDEIGKIFAGFQKYLYDTAA